MPYDTPLSKSDEAAFKKWKQKYAPQDSGADYDLRGAFKSGLEPDPKTGHWPDTYKKPNHPTFSNESKYATGEDAKRAGHWEGDTYVPAPKESLSMAALSTTDEMGPPAPRKPKGKRKLNVGPKGETPRIKNKPLSERSMEKPSAKMQKRNAEKEETKTFAEGLTNVASAIPEGQGPYGRMLKGAAGGAALGATLGEELAKLQSKKRGR